MQTQNEMILEALQKGRELTPLDALSEFGCFRLAARIKDLRDRGVNIEMKKVKSGNGKQFAKYKLAS